MYSYFWTLSEEYKHQEIGPELEWFPSGGMQSASEGPRVQQHIEIPGSDLQPNKLDLSGSFTPWSPSQHMSQTPQGQYNKSLGKPNYFDFKRFLKA